MPILCLAGCGVWMDGWMVANISSRSVVLNCRLVCNGVCDLNHVVVFALVCLGSVVDNLENRG